MTREHNRFRLALAPALVAAAALCLPACEPARSTPPKFQQPMQLGGTMVPARTLQAGYERYTLYCRPCHGDAGDGQGPAAAGLRPPPRDFRQATFKFGWVTDGLPHDDDFTRIARDGLHGTAMLKWGITPRELTEAIQYIKTFAPDDWKDSSALGQQVALTPDTWGAARKQAAEDRGKELYHGKAQCWTCHPAYAPRQYIAQVRGQSTFRDELYLPEIKTSSYKVGDQAIKILPPDFTWSNLKSIRPTSELEDLYRLIGAGIPGTAMPSWKGALPDEDLWALAYYVRSLVALKDTPQAAQLRDELRKQPEFVPPPMESFPADQPGGTKETKSGM